MVRVSRTGGAVANPRQDEAEVLIECWAVSQAESFDLSRSLWALIASVEDQDAIPGIITHHVAPSSSPLQFPDDNAPDMERHQFTITMRVALEETEVPQ